MARVTVEDCISKIPNRFELAIFAAQRTRQISAGAPLLIQDRDNDKNPVVALREIADECVGREELREATINSFRHPMQVDPQEEEFEELFAQETSSYMVSQNERLDGMNIEEENLKEEGPEEEESEASSEKEEESFSEKV